MMNYLHKVCIITSLCAMQLQARPIFPLCRFFSKKIFFHGEWRDSLRKAYTKKELKLIDGFCQETAKVAERQLGKRIRGQNEALAVLDSVPFKEFSSTNLGVALNKIAAGQVKKKSR